MKKQLFIYLFALLLSTPSFGTCEMSANGGRVCGSIEKTPKKPFSSIFSFWGSEEKSKSNIPVLGNKHKKEKIEQQNKKTAQQENFNKSTEKKQVTAIVKPSKELIKKNQIKEDEKYYPPMFSNINVASTNGVTIGCQQNNLLFPKQALSNNTQILDIVADHSEISKNDLYELSGNVSLRSSEYYLSTDNAVIKKSTKTTNANNNVRFQDKDIMLVGESASIRKNNNITYTTINNVNFHYPEDRINGNAKQITNDGTVQVFDSATYSLCPLYNTDWKINANQITLNQERNRGIAKDATLEFFGVPIAYLPRHEWVLKGRGSGFLSPSVGSIDDSYQVKIPYYFNIAPDRDFLLTLSQLSSRGSVVEGVYRQLLAENQAFDKGRFEFEGQYLYKDNITNNDRWLIESSLDAPLNLNNNKSANINFLLNRVSDKNYLKEISSGNTSLSALNSHIGLTYKDNEQDLNMSLFSEIEQLVNNGTSAYTRAPELSINKSFDGSDERNMDLSLISSNFKHKNSSNTTGVRTHAQASFVNPITTDAYSISPSLNLSTTNYSLDNAVDQDRSIYGLAIDSKLFLEREINIFDIDLIQTLVPRLAYNYTPKKDQSSLPSFDSADKSDSYENLFSGQKFTGLDRISNANNFTLGLESEFINEETGDTYLILKAAQTHYIDDVDMASDGTLTSRRNYSDIAMSADVFLNNLTFNNSLQYNPETSRIDNLDSSVGYVVNPRKFITLAYHDNNSTESVEAYGAYPITQKIHIFTGMNYSITDSLLNKSTSGVAYDSCCWALRFVFFDKNGDDESFGLELVFKGLATTSPSLSRRLEDEIPNYLANLDDF